VKKSKWNRKMLTFYAKVIQDRLFRLAIAHVTGCKVVSIR